MADARTETADPIRKQSRETLAPTSAGDNEHSTPSLTTLHKKQKTSPSGEQLSLSLELGGSRSREYASALINLPACVIHLPGHVSMLDFFSGQD